MSKEKIMGVILAGGKNSRMGSDKGLLVVGRKKIIERTIDAIKPVVNEVMIISNGNKYDYLGYRVYPDIIKDCGPMGGIHTGLSFTKTEKNLVVGCDMPFLTCESLKMIIENSDNCEIAIPEHNGKTEPLCAVYSSICRNKLSRLLAGEEWRLKDALKYFNVKQVHFKDVIESKRIFSNINTKEEYQSINNSYEYSG